MLPLDQHTHGPLVDKQKRGWSTWCPECETEYFAVTSKALIAEFTRIHLGDEWAEYELEMVAED